MKIIFQAFCLCLRFNSARCSLTFRESLRDEGKIILSMRIKGYPQRICTTENLLRGVLITLSKVTYANRNLISGRCIYSPSLISPYRIKQRDRQIFALRYFMFRRSTHPPSPNDATFRDLRDRGSSNSIESR